MHPANSLTHTSAHLPGPAPRCVGQQAVLICRVVGERWKAFLRQYPDLSLPEEMQKPRFKERMRRLQAAFLDDCPSFTVLDLSFNDVRPFSPLADLVPVAPELVH